MSNDHSYLIVATVEPTAKRWKARPRSNNPGSNSFGETRELALRKSYADVLRDIASKILRGEIKADNLTLTIQTESPCR